MGKHTADTPPDDVDLSISTRGLSATEIAAVTAVVTAAVHEQAVDAAQSDESGRSAWDVSARRLRSPLTPGIGAWQRAVR